MSARAPRLHGLLLRLRQAQAAAGALGSIPPSSQPQQLLPTFAIGATDASAAPAAPSPAHQHQQQTRAKRTVRVVLKRDDPITGGRAGDVVRVPAGRQRLDLFPAGAADYATPRVLREAREEQRQSGGSGGSGGSAAAEAAAAAAAAKGEASAPGADDDDDQASLQQALEVLASKPVVLRRRGKPSSSSPGGEAGGEAGGGGGDSGGGGGSGARVIGRVTRADVARAVERQLGVALDERLVLMGDDGIRAFGEYRVPLNVVAAAQQQPQQQPQEQPPAGTESAKRQQAHVRVEVVRTWR